MSFTHCRLEYINHIKEWTEDDCRKHSVCALWTMGTGTIVGVSLLTGTTSAGHYVSLQLTLMPVMIFDKPLCFWQVQI